MSDISICPFNKEHRMASKNLQRHLIKCMANYPNHEVCPYNALHRFPTKEKFIEHLLCCPNKRLGLASFLAPKHEGGDVSEQIVHIDNVRKINLEYENWDES